MKVAVLGVGLIGGSIGLAARARGQARVIGWDLGWEADAEAREAALRLGAIDEHANDVLSAVRDADVVFVATPVGALADTVRMALDAAGPDTIVTDVGSTKRVLAGEIADPRFVGGHPLAGSELAGVENARADLFEQATWFLCAAGSRAGHQPGDERRQETLLELIASLGATPVEIDPGDHDRLMANVSQLPHVLANLLVDQAAAAWEHPPAPAPAAAAPGAAREPDTGVSPGERAGDAFAVGPSFRDATRVAGSNSAVWTDIYMSNREALASAIDELSGRLAEVRELLRKGDAQALTDWNERARDERDALLAEANRR